MYGQEFEVSDEVMDPEFLIPIGQAKIMRAGTDVTITAFSRMVGVALKAAEQLEKEGISCEVILSNFFFLNIKKKIIFENFRKNSKK